MIGIYILVAATGLALGAYTSSVAPLMLSTIAFGLAYLWLHFEFKRVPPGSAILGYIEIFFIPSGTFMLGMFIGTLAGFVIH